MKRIEPLSYKQVEAARAVGVDVRTFRRWARQGLVKGHRVGGTVLYAKDELLKLIGVQPAK